MGLFSWFRNRRKKKNKDKQILEEFLGEPPKEILSENGNYRNIETEGYLLGRLEDLLDEIKSLNEAKDEYYEVVDYINDIQMLESLDEEELYQLQHVSNQLISLGKAQEDYLNYGNKLTNEQFNMMRMSENEIENIVRRMQDNESYYSTLKRDMGYLESERNEWILTKEKLNREEILLRKGSTWLFSVFIVLCIVLFVMQFAFDIEIRIPFLIAAVSVAIIGVGIFWRLGQDSKSKRQAEKNLNYAIELLNKVKLKYVNTQNALDYTANRFDVNNSYELTYLWEEYLKALKREESFEKVKEDISYYERSMEMKLKNFHLKNRNSWLLKPEIFVDDKQMLLLKQELYRREERLKKDLKYKITTIRNSRDEITRLINRQPTVSKEIIDILDSIDELLGNENW